MTADTKFDLGDWLDAGRKLKIDAEEAISRVDEPGLDGVIADLSEISFSGDSSARPPFEIAFIGQYNAGKSTILRALTGDSDIQIDSDVCTDKVTAYQWRGIRLLDTPGIHAHYPDHDQVTYKAIEKADLLVFVVTNELFDETIGAHFRTLAFSNRRASEMLLVVNKIGQDPGTAESKERDIERVTKPLTPRDFRIVFIDAKSVLDAENEVNDRDRLDLLEIGNFCSFISELNRFVGDRGFAGRLTSPLFSIRAACEHTVSVLSVDHPEEKAAVELLRRKRGLYLSARARLRSKVIGLINRAVGDLTSYGDDVAESIEPGKTESDIELLHRVSEKKASDRSAALSEEIRECVELEMAEISQELVALSGSALARKLRNRVDIAGSNVSTLPDTEEYGSAWDGANVPGRLSDWPAQSKKITEIAKKIGHGAVEWATGPMAEGANLGTATAARGSEAHKVVYSVGKFFGVKFQPWGAVRVARIVGNAGRIIAAVGGLLAVVAQVMEEKQQAEYTAQLRESRDSIRSVYRDAALEVQSAVVSQFENFCREYIDSELDDITKTTQDLVGHRAGRAATVGNLRSLVERADNLIERVQANRSDIAATPEN